MTTLSALRTIVRNHIGDTSVVSPNFTDAELTDFINRAIEDLNAHFPRRTIYEIATIARDHEYYIETPHQQLLSVEYPAGRTPPRYLARLAYTDPAFWQSDQYYDFMPSNDAGALNPPRIVISANPSANQTIRLELTTEHNQLTATNDVTSIPDRLLHLISLFVRWKTWESLASQEGMDPNPLKNITSTHGLNATRAETTYRLALAAAKSAYTESAITPWPLPDHDRIY